jgi:hypothetical protein
MFSKLVDRNNTSFPKEMMEAIRKMKKEDEALRYHQKLVVDYFLEYGVRGMIIYHEMGSGKTIIAVATFIELLVRGYKAVFFSNKGLHNNFKDDVRKYHSLSSIFRGKFPNVEDFIDQINFVSSNASNALTKLRKLSTDSLVEQNEDTPLNFERMVIVCDEAHNLFNAISNESTNAMGFYNAAMATEDARFLFLTGNPIINNPFEFILGVNMCAGLIEGKSLFSPDYQENMKQFVSDAKSSDAPNDEPTIPRIKNADKFSDKIFGLVSYFGADNEAQKARLPHEYHPIIRSTCMSTEQYSVYASAREKEIKETSLSTRPSAAFGKPAGGGGTYRVNSRQTSNFMFPKEAIKRDPITMEYYKDISALTTENLMDGLHVLSPKFCDMLKCISMHTPDYVLADMKPTPEELEKAIKKYSEINGADGWTPGIGKGIVYSQFSTSGLEPLEARGFARISSQSDALSYAASRDKKGSYVLMSGEMDVNERKFLLDVFNSPDNDQGEMIMLLLISSVGVEGINTECVRHTHQMEPYWNYSRASQFKSRAIRPESHKRLPVEERNVQPYIHLADYPMELLKSEIKREPTTDRQIFFNSIQNQVLINSFLEVIQESSIDCTAHYEGKKNCRICTPTGKTLWKAGVTDLVAPSPCTRLTEKKITAQSLMYDGTEYMYTIADERIHIFSFVPEINSYKEIFGDHPDYDAVYIEIAKKYNMSY